MKTKSVSLIRKGKTVEFNIAVFESLDEARASLGARYLNVVNLGSATYAKALALGQDPFKTRKKRYVLDKTKISEELFSELEKSGALS